MLDTQKTVIKLENLSKRFELVAESSGSIFDLLKSFLPGQQRLSLPKKKREDLWAVRDVDLEIEAGQCIGIIGKNGSGKSTLLKLIARILLPTKGRIMVKGRLSALLELGTGFHPDLTGRENIYLNAAVLGLSRQDINKHFESVVAFSELEQFIDTPVKYYSSGMYMRLGFSIAIHVEPKVLIVDEILAVGDQAFQEKCINQIYEMKRQGTTIVIVSHNLDVLRKLCTHLVWMDQGHMRAYGKTETLIQKYLAFLQESGQRVARGSQAKFERGGTGEVEITVVRFLNQAGEEKDVFITGSAMTIEMEYHAHKSVNNPEFGLAIYRTDGVQVNGPNTQFAGFEMEKVYGRGILRYHIPDLPLLPASYSLTVAIHDSNYPIAYDVHDKAYPFRVESGGTREIFGLVQIEANWEWHQEEPDSERIKNPL